MKTWSRPAAVGQQFAANDYVSACNLTIKCDFSTGESLHGGGLVVPDGVGGFSGGEYRPCNHEFVVNAEQLKSLTFTHFTEGPTDAPSASLTMHTIGFRLMAVISMQLLSAKQSIRLPWKATSPNPHTHNQKGRVAFTLKNVICDTPFVIFMNIVLPFFL